VRWFRGYSADKQYGIYVQVPIHAASLPDVAPTMSANSQEILDYNQKTAESLSVLSPPAKRDGFFHNKRKHLSFILMKVKSAETRHPDSSIPDETSLVHQAQSGDADSFARLYDACVERVYRYVYFRVADDATAEDITSQVFLKAWEHLDRYRSGNASFLAWLYTIARNQVIDHYRTRKESVPLDKIASLPAPGRTVAEQIETNFDLQAMRDALQFLTEEQQQVLILKFIVEMTTEDIAQAMNKNEGAIRALQMRALQALSKYLEEEKLHERF